MTLGPRPKGLGDLALRAANRPGAWLVLLIADADAINDAGGELIDELSLVSRDPPTHIATPGTPEELAKTFAHSPPGVLVVSGLDRYTSDDWHLVDLLRSRYQRQASVVLLMSEASMGVLMRHAPNLASWIAGTVWSWDRHADQLSDSEREARLDALRRWAGFSDDELVRLAERGELPGDPEYAEWLVLLGRGELCRRE